MVYFDNAATTFPKPRQVIEAVQEMTQNQCVNAGRGSYKAAVHGVQMIEECKDNLLKIAGSSMSNSVVFAPSATIALNMLIGGIHLEQNHIVYVSAYEHNAVMRPLYHKQQKIGFTIRQIPIDKKTMLVDEEKLEYEFRQYPPDLVCVTHISNVTGYILPVHQICHLAKQIHKKVVTIVDGSQSLGLIEEPLSQEDSVDYYVFAGHKTLYGIFGLGGFICHSSMSHELIANQEKYTPYLCGGTGSDSLNLQMDCSTPQDLEVGSQNMVAVAGLLAALKWRMEERHISQWYEQEQQKTRKLIQGLKQIKGVRLYLPEGEHHQISIVSFNIKGYKADEVGMILDEDYQIAVRTGYHCTPLIHGLLRDEEYRGTIRASVGSFTTDTDIKKLLQAVEELAEEM